MIFLVELDLQYRFLTENFVMFFAPKKNNHEKHLEPTLHDVRVTLAFSCEAVWRGPGQAQRLSGPTELSIPWRPALRRRDGLGVGGTGVARQSHRCQGRDRPVRQLQRLVGRQTQLKHP